MRSLLLIFLGLSLLVSCESEAENYNELLKGADYFHEHMDKLTDYIVHDIFSPPVASRVYVYPCIAAYEVIRNESPRMATLVGRLNGLDKLPLLDTTKEISLPLASLHAFYTVGKSLIHSGDSLTRYHNAFIEDLDRMRFPKEIKDSSLAYGDKVGKAILAWANEDQYKETRSYPKFTVDQEPNTWKPTPPAYMESIEPHWNQIRTLVLDSATQFVPQQPTEFDLSEGSMFKKELMEVYAAVKDANEEEIEIANFWDCNPYKMNQSGHVMFATKKITPGGHWIGITKIAAKSSKLGLSEAIEAYTYCSIALFDGFISCWDEKYRSKLIRPETVINEHLDEDWIPILQTPPFPEHTSGHSVISRAAAMVLSEIFGQDYAFEDDTELQYGLPIRSFSSFKQASEEAAISRLYGGIHYRPAIDYGVQQGEKVGLYVIKELGI